MAEVRNKSPKADPGHGYGMFEGASKKILNLKILPRRDRAPPPRFEIPRSATDPGRTTSQIVFRK